MKVKNLKTKMGVVILFSAFSLNAIYAFNDYGITTNNLHDEIWAQSEGAQGGRTTGGSSVKCNCGAVWGSGCKADNYGSTCATSTQSCWSYDKNCS